MCLFEQIHAYVFVFIHHFRIEGATYEDEDGAAGIELRLGTFMEVNADGNVVTDLFKCPDMWVCY